MMNERTQLGLSILGVAGFLGILGDVLGLTSGLGVNALLWVAVAGVAVWGLARQHHLEMAGGGRWLAVAALLFAAGFAWRDSPVLRFFDALALLTSAAFVVMRGRFGRVRLAEISEYSVCLVMSGLYALFGMFRLVIGDIEWRQIPRDGWMRQALAITRGLAFALPLLLLFGGLFMAADAVFARMVSRMFNIDVEAFLNHLFGMAFLAWVVGGLLRATLLREERPPFLVPERQLVSLGIVEMGMALGLLDALFLAFVIVQIRYLFGGQALVLATTGMTYAQYARQGFFELVTVAALVLLLLLFAHWLLRKDSLKTERIFRGLAGVMVGLLFVIMASAVQRMRLYQSEYGLTELRVYTTAFMGWLALVFVWFAATVLREQRERFAFGAMLSAFAMLGFLHIINPDGGIARANAALARQGKTFDADYALSLSADAVPALTRALPLLPEPQRALVQTRLHQRWTKRDSDWRFWNYARAQSRRFAP